MSNAIGGNNNLAAELLLNKIMNGQVQTESGKTVTAGSRSKSSELNRQAIAPSIASANVKAGVATAMEIQTRLTEGKTYLENLDKALADATPAAASKLAKDAMEFMNAFATATIEGKLVFRGSELTANQVSVSLGLGTDTLAIGGIDFSAYITAGTTSNLLKDLGDATAATTDAELKILVDLVRDALAASIETANSNLGVTGMQVQTLEGRSAILDDVSATYTDAASQQFVVETGGSTNLLNNVLN